MIDIKIKALQFAMKKHRSQYRKYTIELYINHCINVAELVRTVNHDDNMIAAAYLHDTVEDTETTIEEIIETFGSTVGEYVYWLTDSSKPSDGNRATRKAIDRERLSKSPPNVKTIKLADLIDNSQSIVEHDEKFAKVYLKEKRLLLNVLTEGDTMLWNIANDILIKHGY